MKCLYCTCVCLSLFILSGIIITGSGESVNGRDLVQYDPDIFSTGVPILGICYGFQLIVVHFGGQVGRERTREDGQFEITLDTSSPLFQNMSSNEKVLLTHGDSVQIVSQFLYYRVLSLCCVNTCINE